MKKCKYTNLLCMSQRERCKACMLGRVRVRMWLHIKMCKMIISTRADLGFRKKYF